MSENIMAAAENYSAELDKVFTAKSATAFLADNALRTKFVGSKTVMIPEVDFDGLADYDRKTGFVEGAVNVGHTAYTMTMDRARSFSIDREDMDEAGIASLAGKILGEYVRTKVVPECDAYTISKIAKTAETRGNIVKSNDTDMAFYNFKELVGQVQNAVGYDEELVCFVDSMAYSALCGSEEFSRMLTISDFKQGGTTIKVKSINGITIIPVVSERMRTEQDFHENGFNFPEEFSQVYMLVMPKSAAHLVKKTEKMRFFSPEQNANADAYKFDYRIYYDVFVKESAIPSIWAWISSKLYVFDQGSDIETNYTEIECIPIYVESQDDISIEYRWYECDDYDRRGARPTYEKTSTFEVSSETPVGVHYYYCKVTPYGMAPIYTKVCKVTVK